MKKILVIFFFSIIFSLLIYYYNKPVNNNILIISEYNSINDKYKDYNVSIYLFDKITYKELINEIKSNDSIIIKNKRIYLNQLINKSNFLVININNKNNKTNQEKYKKLLTNTIKRISNTKIIFINNETNEFDIIY